MRYSCLFFSIQYIDEGMVPMDYRFLLSLAIILLSTKVFGLIS